MTNKREERAARAEQMRKELERSAKRQRNLITIAILVVVTVLIAVAWWGIETSRPHYQKDVITPKGATASYGIVYDAAAAGATPPKKAPPTIELYEDFQCPVCQQFEATSGAAVQALVKSGKATVIFKPWSFLDPKASLNEYSHRSTNVALLVLEKGGVEKFVEFHDYLYAHQPDENTAGPSDKELIAAAKSLGVNVDEQAVKDRKFFPWIDAAMTAGEKRGVTGTPTVYVAGKKLPSYSLEAILVALNSATKK